MSAVTLRGVRKVFRGLLKETVAVQDLSLEVRDREFVTLLGPSGCGKSTTLRMVAGLELPTAGEIFFDADCVNDLPPQRRNVSMVFQNYAIFPHFTVRENIGYHLRISGVPRHERHARVAEVARLLRIDHLLDQKPRQLSGGERQRVALGRAIIRRPRVFLLDEPLSNLDAKLRDQMRVEIKRIQRAVETTVIYVTHDQLEAMTMSDRIAVMNAGRLHQYDTPGRVFGQPVDRFVAQFVGSPSMNFLPGTLEERDGDLFVHCVEFRLAIGRDRRHALPQTSGERQVDVGIRPHAMALSRDREGPGITAVAEVILLEPVGAQTYVHARLGETSLVVIADDAFSAAIGDRVALRFHREDVHLFDAGSGRSLLHGL